MLNPYLLKAANHRVRSKIAQTLPGQGVSAMPGLATTDTSPIQQLQAGDPLANPVPTTLPGAQPGQLPGAVTPQQQVPDPAGPDTQITTSQGASVPPGPQPRTLQPPGAGGGQQPTQ